MYSLAAARLGYDISVILREAPDRQGRTRDVGILDTVRYLMPPPPALLHAVPSLPHSQAACHLLRQHCWACKGLEALHPGSALCCATRCACAPLSPKIHPSTSLEQGSEILPCSTALATWSARSRATAASEGLLLLSLASGFNSGCLDTLDLASGVAYVADGAIGQTRDHAFGPS